MKRIASKSSRVTPVVAPFRAAVAAGLAAGTKGGVLASIIAAGTLATPTHAAVIGCCECKAGSFWLLSRPTCALGGAACTAICNDGYGGVAWWDCPWRVFVPVADTFDCYENGSRLDGHGGWAGWDDNPAVAGSVTDAQSLSAPHSAEIEGPDDAVQEYSGATSGQWTYTIWQYVPSTMVGQTYFILLNYTSRRRLPPEDPGCRSGSRGIGSESEYMLRVL